MRIRDGKNSDPGSRMEKLRIWDKHPGSTTLRYPLPLKALTLNACQCASGRQGVLLELELWRHCAYVARRLYYQVRPYRREDTVSLILSLLW